MTEKPITYADTGVNRERHYELVKRIAAHTGRTNRPGVLGGIGAFGGFFAPDLTKYPNPVLVSGTDGVGTKLKLAFQSGRHDTVGQDLVAMCVNDILCQGAEPLFFLDYIGVGEKDLAILEQVVRGVADGCLLAGCALIGGETAELPGMYAPGEYDMAGFAVGIVNRDRIITGEQVQAGDKLVGLASSGLHSNGYSLARRVLLGAFAPDDRPAELGGATVMETMLTPTRIYAKSFLALYERFAIHGAANITGGGFHENIPRMLRDGVQAVLDWGTWEVPPIFGLIQQHGPVEDREMESTFNMGLGMVLAVPAATASDVVAAARELGEQAWVVGEVVNGEPGVEVRR
ncbi:MAG TPA: phosphoribosylformylglycinamidine cyclo-ligase [Symbiobacteriaceae bacterium]|nr:phosphoribosylformylglycinamidine cyclo-ligase [Symbiobacteriaceae bacterium]